VLSHAGRDGAHRSATRSAGKCTETRRSATRRNGGGPIPKSRVAGPIPVARSR
jgi:hypothetical protein